MTVTDKMIESAARAVFKLRTFQSGSSTCAVVPSELAIAEARAALAAIDAAGLVIVPKEPDELVIYAMRDAHRSTRVSGISGQTVDACYRNEFARDLAAYRAMIAASQRSTRGQEYDLFTEALAASDSAKATS